MIPSNVSLTIDAVIQQASSKQKDKKRLTLWLWGSPGLGKTKLVEQAGERNKMPVFTVRLTDKDTVDFMGVPQIVNGETVFATPQWLPKTGKFLLFLDEYAQALLPMQNAANQAIDGRIGNWVLPDGCIVIIASNRLQDRAGTTPTPQHVNNRVVHIEMETSHADFHDWGIANGINKFVLTYLDQNQQMLSVPSTSEKAFPSPRSWEHISHIINLGLPEHIQSELIVGTIGEGAGNAFNMWLRVASKIINWKDILNNPTTAELPDGPAPAQVLMYNLATNVTLAKADNLFTYLRRIHPEYAALCVNLLERKNAVLKETSAYKNWQLDQTKNSH